MLPSHSFGVHKRWSWSPLIALSLAMVSGGSVACSPDSRHEEPCDAPEPAFTMQVTASGGAELPVGTRIRVEYGGNLHESFILSEQSTNEDVCCESVGDPISGRLPRVSCAPKQPAADAGPVNAILCTLWTNGPAAVAVRADGFLSLEQNLNSKYRENRSCGVETVEARLTLGRPEGGI